MTNLAPIKKVIVALDGMDLEQCCHFLTLAKGHFHCVKIGMELFNRYGRDLIQKIYYDYGMEIFLDLKLHDIPNTVRGGIHSLRGTPIKFLTIHLTGGQQMIREALEETFISLPRCTLLGVSYLTSLGSKDFEQIWGPLHHHTEGLFINLFKMAGENKLPGVVCSGMDLNLVKKIEEECITTFTKVCPGIRFLDEIQSGKTQDQKRTMAPQQALTAGADFLVIGRSLTQAPTKLLEQRIEELSH